MSFTHDPSTDEGLLRTLIYDTDSTDYVFEDDELINILDLNEGDLWSAASDLCNALASKYTKSSVNINLGKYDLVVDTRKKADSYLALAKRYSIKASSSSVIEYIDSVDYHVDVTGIIDAEFIGD